MTCLATIEMGGLRKRQTRSAPSPSPGGGLARSGEYKADQPRRSRGWFGERSDTEYAAILPVFCPSPTGCARHTPPNVPLMPKGPGRREPFPHAIPVKLQEI